MLSGCCFPHLLKTALLACEWRFEGLQEPGSSDHVGGESRPRRQNPSPLCWPKLCVTHRLLPNMQFCSNFLVKILAPVVEYQ